MDDPLTLKWTCLNCNMDAMEMYFCGEHSSMILSFIKFIEESQSLSQVPQKTARFIFS